MAAYNIAFEEKILLEPYESVAEEIEIVYADANYDSANYSYQLCEEFPEVSSKMDENCTIEVHVATFDGTIFKNHNEFSSDMHCLGEVEISSEVQISDSTNIDTWNSSRASSGNTSTVNNSITSFESLSADIRCRTPDECVMSSSHDSGISLTRKSFSSIEQFSNCNVGWEQKPDRKELPGSFRAENRARLCRELDLCHLREVKKGLRTPSPAGNGLYSYIDRSDMENFGVDCYYRSTRTSSQSMSLTPSSVSSKEGLKLVDFNIPQADSMHYDGRSVHPSCGSRVSLKVKQPVHGEIDAFDQLSNKGCVEHSWKSLKCKAVENGGNYKILRHLLFINNSCRLLIWQYAYTFVKRILNIIQQNKHINKATTRLNVGDWLKSIH